MKRFITISILFASMNIGAFAQSGWFWQNPMPQGNHLTDVFLIDNNTGWAVGYSGTILKTTNGGANWLLQTSGTSNWLGSVHFTDTNTGWAVGNSGTILKTTNGGTVWTQQASVTISWLNSVYFTDSNTGWTVGGDYPTGIILKTTNGGINWTQQASVTNYGLSSVYFTDSNTGWALGYATIFKTTNGGTNWTPTIIWSEGLSSVHFTDSNTGWAVGGDGGIFNTTNGGTNWTSQSISSSYSLSSVYFTNSNTGWVVDNLYGMIFKTTNGGANWTPQTSGFNSNKLSSVYFRDSNTGWTVGTFGTIFKTTNGGIVWTPQTSVTISWLNSVYFTDSNTGWAVGADYTTGIIVKTTNGGTVWTQQASVTSSWLSSVYFTDSNTGWTVGKDYTTGIILKTTNGGTVWTQQASVTSSWLSSVYFTDSNTGWTVGSGGTIFKTTNRGTVWTQQASVTSNGLSSVYFTDSNTGWTVGSGGTIFKTTNGGTNWTSQSISPSYDLSSVHFTNSNTGWVVGGYSNIGQIFNTTNGGTNWTSQSISSSYSLSSVHFTDSNTGWAVGGYYNMGQIFNTTNGGTNWTSQSISSSYPLSSVYFTDSNTGWAVGEYGAILKYIGGGSASLIITSPNGGETFLNGQQVIITWNSQAVQSVKIEYTSNNGGTWSTLSASYPADSGRFAWTVPNINSTQCKIRISQVGGSLTDISDYPFMISNSMSSLSGKIRNSVDSSAVSAATVILTSQFNQTFQTTTDSIGNYTFLNISAGSYSVKVTKQGFRPSDGNLTAINGPNVYNSSITPNNVNEIVLSEGKLKIFADNIVTLENSYFKLTGNVNINGILYFSGEVRVDKNSTNYKPIIESSSKITAKNILGSDSTFMNLQLPYKMYVDGNDLIPKSFGYLFEMPIVIQGFPLKLSGIMINSEGTEVQVSTLANFPYPLNRLAGWAVTKKSGESDFDALKRFADSYSGKLIFNRNLGIGYELELSIPDKLSLGFIDLEELDVQWNSQTQNFTGGIKIAFPDRSSSGGNSLLSNHNQNSQNIKIEFVDRQGNLILESTLDNLKETLPPSAIEALFALRFEIELRAGVLERVSASLSEVRIPSPIPGLFITEINADVENLTDSLRNILIRLTCDLETGLPEVPIVGPPFTIDNAGGEFVPSSYVKLLGGMKLFNREISDASAEFNYRDAFVRVKGNVNIMDIIHGDLNSTLKYGYFGGSIRGTVKTPSSFLPPLLKWWNIENRIISDAQINVENNTIIAQARFARSTVAVKLIFGNPTSVFIGLNLKHMIQIFRSTNDAAQSVTFVVPENTPAILVVADNGTNLFDFILQDPYGRVYDSTNAEYDKYGEVRQTVMYVENPRSGEWNFITSQTGQINLYTMGVDQAPAQILNSPEVRNSLSSQVSLRVNDYSDTVDISVYYDNNNRDFNGTLIKKFRLINNANINFEWNNNDVPDGEYFIYTVANDNKNAPVSQYAPGSIMVENVDFEVRPTSLSAYNVGDSARLSWMPNSNGRIDFAKVTCLSMKDNTLKYFTARDTNITELKGLEYGRKYRIWANYVDSVGNYGPTSDTIEFVYMKDPGNDPPCIISGTENVWTYIEGEHKSYKVELFDADANAVSLRVASKPKGIRTNGNKIEWTPAAEDVGLHYILLIASDGLSYDTLKMTVLVRSEKESRIAVSFNSPNLYDSDNKFVKLKNIRAVGQTQNVIVRNLRTGSQSNLSCRRIGESEFISDIELGSLATEHFPIQHRDTVTASYSYNGSDYVCYSVYDTASQSTDNVPPARISDLSAQNNGLNKALLRWTAPGDNGSQGEALKYDIRYSFLPIIDESSFLNAQRIIPSPYPSTAGSTDSFTVNIQELTGYLTHDTVYFSIKAEDAQQNRSELGNSLSFKYLSSPVQLISSVSGIHNVGLSWTGVEGPLSQILGEEVDAAVFKHYRLFRRTDTTEFLLVKDSILQNSYTDNLYYNADDTYFYALQAVYDIGGSDTIYSESIVMNRFSDVRISCQISGSSNVNDSIQIFITGLDSVYFHSYFASTGPAGIVTFNNVYNSSYSIRMVKQGVGEILDTIVINDTLSQYNYSFATLMKVRVGIEGMYNILTGKLNSKDTLKIYLRSSIAPYSVADSTLAVLDSTNMYADCAFENAPSGQYYIVVKHRNSIETWSKSGGEQFIKNSIMEYDFTDASSKAFGENLTRVGSVWCLFSGDVNQDGTVDASDLSSVDNDAANFISGYVTTDLTGDGFVDGTDFAIVDNNAASFVSVVRP
jgi:photosystem II stability/assembly factor-like uncharacterized protein